MLGLLRLIFALGFTAAIMVGPAYLSHKMGFAPAWGLLVPVLFLSYFALGLNAPGPHPSRNIATPNFISHTSKGTITKNNTEQLYVDTGYDGATYSVVSRETGPLRDRQIALIRFDRDGNSHHIKDFSQFGSMDDMLREYVSEDAHRWFINRNGGPPQ